MAKKSRVIVIPIDDNNNVRTDYTRIVTNVPTARSVALEVIGFSFVAFLCSVFTAIVMSAK